MVRLDAQALADPGVRAEVVRARDLLAGLGDMDASLYLLFRAIRDHSTVALSGESADEVFGGYLQFFDEEALRADTFPGWEKTLLREATADVLPQSVYDRVKSPYPSTQDPQYAAALQDQAKDLLTRTGHPVFDLVDPGRLRRAAERKAPMNSQADPGAAWNGPLDLALWLDLYQPELDLS
ncbi:asparagine synthase-related protein [Streptomyces sp. MPA0124]|uniref:asparagine synthase-related protein n=1 Tax=Streptomyces sp. MPA0124 TaxID=3378069 RepID=UPI003853A9E1